MYLLVYDQAQEPITQAILAEKSRIRGGLATLSVKEILNQLEIADKIEDGVASLQWTLPDGTHIRNDGSVLLINRVFGLSPELFHDFADEDQTYALQEFWAYLSFALSSFPKKTAAPCFLGLSGPHAPLPYQWSRAARLACKVPEYYLGVRSSLSLEDHAENVVRSQIYDLNWWRAEPGSIKAPKDLDYDPDEHIFAFVRPTGSPVLIFLAGQYSIVEPLGEEIPHHLLQEALKLSVAIQKDFAVHFAELLFFVCPDSGQLTFGRLSLAPSEQVAERSDFPGLVTSSLEDLLP